MGKKITSKVTTTGQASKIVLTPDKTTIIADGKDANVINISFVDSQGREVPDANNTVYFTISGDAKIIGVGNGDPSSHEPDQCRDGAWQRSAFNGKCQVIIQVGKTSGTIKLEAKANGLVSATTILLSK